MKRRCPAAGPWFHGGDNIEVGAEPAYYAVFRLFITSKGEAERRGGLGLRGFSHSRCCCRASLGEVQRRLFRGRQRKLEKHDGGARETVPAVIMRSFHNMNY